MKYYDTQTLFWEKLEVKKTWQDYCKSTGQTEADFIRKSMYENKDFNKWLCKNRVSKKDLKEFDDMLNGRSTRW